MLILPACPGASTLVSMLRREVRELSGPRELLDFFPPVPRNLASPAKRAYKEL